MSLANVSLQNCNNETSAYAADSTAAAIARYSSKYRPDSQDSKRALAMVMSLDPHYFPEELYTNKERKCVLH